MSDDVANLSPAQMDALREIGNVGAGNSATALSQIISRRIDMDVPRVSIVPLDEVPDMVGGPDTMVVGVFLRVYGKAPSNILFLLPKESAFYLVDMLMGKTHGDTQKLDFMDESALMEIGNILSGAYLNALFNFTNISLLPSIPALAIDMDVPRVSIVPLDEVPDLVGGPDTMVVGVFLRVYGKAPSNILFLLPKESAFYLVDMLMGKTHGDTQKLDFMDESALMEIGNILSGAYLNALFNFTNISLLPSIPALAMDMAGAILSVVLVQLGQMGDHALVIETEFKTDDDGIKGHFFLVPDPGSLDIILQAVGVS